MERREKSKERNKRKKRKKKEKEKEKKTKPRYVFILKSWVFWIPKDLVWRFVSSFLGLCGRDHPNSRFVEVLWVKPQLVENKHGIIKIIWFYIELVNLGLSS